MKKLFLIICFFALSSILLVPPAESRRTAKISGTKNKGETALLKNREGLSPAEKEFVDGFIALKLGDFGRAGGYFKKLQGKLPLIEDYIDYFLGVSLLKSGSSAEAISVFENILLKYPKSMWRADSLWQLANAHFELGKYNEALSALGKVEITEKSGPSPSEFNFLKASILGAMGDTGGAARILKNVYLNSDSRYSMSEALRRLKKMDGPHARAVLDEILSPATQIQVALGLIAMYRADEAVEILEDLGKREKGLYPREMLADAYFKARQYEKAQKIYSEMVEKGDSSLENLLQLAKSSARSNHFDKAMEIYEGLIDKYPNNSTLYRYKLGFLYMDSGQFEKAADKFLGLLNSNVKGNLLDNILWNTAWCYYRLEKYPEAVEYFERFSVGGFGRDGAQRAKYWIARSQERMGKKDAARATYSELKETDGYGYYGFLARGKLSGPRSNKKESEKFFMGETEGALKPEKIRLLEELGFEDFVIDELKRMKWQLNETNSVALYNKTVDFFSSQYKVPRPLVYSIIKQESHFLPDVVSKAGAVGLMQIIPPTAERLAAELNYTPFYLKELYRPSINIRFGTKYLGNLLKMFGSDTALAVASYNAGEDAVMRWRKISHAKDVEEFIEEIPYEETNHYVKIVLKNLWTYEELY